MPKEVGPEEVIVLLKFCCNTRIRLNNEETQRPILILHYQFNGVECRGD